MLQTNPSERTLEIDRGSEPATKLCGKIEQYYDYRAAAGGDDLTVLLVTPGPDRANEPLAVARALARTRRVPLLDVRATTASNLATHGPWAPIWRDAHGQGRPLDVLMLSAAGEIRTTGGQSL